jgi:hypothetical protein
MSWRIARRMNRKLKRHGILKTFVRSTFKPEWFTLYTNLYGTTQRYVHLGTHPIVAWRNLNHFIHFVKAGTAPAKGGPDGIGLDRLRGSGSKGRATD